MTGALDVVCRVSAGSAGGRAYTGVAAAGRYGILSRMSAS